jgi:hypothetical protein
MESTCPTFFLAKDIGVFVDECNSPDWHVTVIGRSRWIVTGAGSDPAHPQFQSASAKHRRVWRELLMPGIGVRGDSKALALARYVASNPPAFRGLPTVASWGEGTLPQLKPRGALPHFRLGVFANSIVALANSAIGIAKRRFIELAEEVFGVNTDLAFRILRAWTESQLIDEAVNLRWSNRLLLAVPPFLSVHSADIGLRAIVSGLALSSTLGDIEEVASSFGVSCELVSANSPFVPSTVGLTFESLEQLRALSRRLQMTTRYVREKPFAPVGTRDLKGMPPSHGYTRDRTTTLANGGQITRFWRPGAPAYWTVRNGDFRTWTYFWNAALFWALATESLTECQVHDDQVEVDGYPLPLAATRWLGAIGGRRAGPSIDGSDQRNTYPAPTEDVANRFLEYLHGFVAEGLCKDEGELEDNA